MKGMDSYYIGTVTAMQELMLSMPQGAVPKHVGIKDDLIWLWAEVDWDNFPEEHRIFVVGDGYSLSGEEGPYIGTVIHYTEYNTYVWHFYDSKNPLPPEPPEVVNG